VRLAEIDTPESRQTYGSWAKQALSALVFGKEVRVVVNSLAIMTP
jgi:endonuclease YncB( thermonuclease family)